MSESHAMRWDIFCRVIDNHGDVGVCWRLACDLAARGHEVRLWLDDASALAWMAPGGARGVSVHGWPEAASETEPGDVVIEAFGCALPGFVVEAMANSARAPVWINLEHLSAETFVERSHGLPSPQAGGLRKWFFYPGFTPRTGGLIREADLLRRQQAFDADTWLGSQDVVRHNDEQIVSLFCYEQPALPALLEHFAQLAQRPTLLLATAGQAARQVDALLGPSLRRGGLRVQSLPALSQTDYDHLLWASDFNFVRGEDSFVRAQWAGKPFVWQIYRQADGAAAAKLQAFMCRFLLGADAELQISVRQTWLAWNAEAKAVQWPAWPDAPPWRQHALNWRTALLRLPDLAAQLIDFAVERR